ncbi:lipopolysaccharide kinase InaA family protein [Lentisphaerota bacterium ZTH]|nr:hypothetical protein JYG24_12925 [Lentisphaerota bacterium]WET05611.1 lipopolysaccharide kinase InaA family protein [Lentisphaerota bacterium ZTH]
MTRDLKVVKRNGWTWHIVDPQLLDGWFNDWESFCQDSCIKSNPVRRVFTVDNLFHVKLEQPLGAGRKLKSFFSPKASKEFNVGRALEAAGIKVVKHLGWARKGSHNMLLTESLQAAVSVHDYWMRQIVFNGGDRTHFLLNYAAFLKEFLNSGFYHPDFHCGNILYSPQSKSFALVDVYGISKPARLTAKQRHIHEHIVFEFKYGIDREEAAALIVAAGIKKDINSALSFWHKGLTAEYRRIRNAFPKRLQQLNEYYPKYVNRIETDDSRVFVIKLFPTGLAEFTAGEIPDNLNGNHFDVMQVPADAARDLWIKSFKLNLLGIDHIQPLIFEEPNVLYFEKVQKGTSEAFPEDIACLEEKAELCGIEIADTRILKTAAGRVMIEDIRQVGLD